MHALVVVLACYTERFPSDLVISHLILNIGLRTTKRSSLFQIVTVRGLFLSDNLCFIIKALLKALLTRCDKLQ